MNTVVVAENSTSTRFIPSKGPLVASQETRVSPCMYEMQVSRGQPGHFIYTASRTSVAGVREMVLQRHENGKFQAVPLECLQEYVDILGSVDVKSTVNSDGSISRTVTPDVTRYSNTTVLDNPTRRGAVSYEKLRAGGSNSAVSSKQTKPSQPSLAQSAGGQSAGGFPLPDPKEALRAEWKFNDQDLYEMQTGVGDDLIEMDSDYSEELKVNPNNVAYYTSDSYGSVRNQFRRTGFPFLSRYVPYAALQDRKYMEYLVSLEYKLRADFPDFHFHRFDPVVSTIATMESYILTTLGRLETYGMWFNRKAMFEGAKPFAGKMHRYLLKYAFEKPTKIWKSPLAMRYLQVPNRSVNPRPAENTALDNLVAGYESLRSVNVPSNHGEKNPDGSIITPYVAIPLQLNYINGENPTLGLADIQVRGIVESELLSALARLQYMHGYVLNTGIGAMRAFSADIAARRYYSLPLKSYLESFILSNDSKLYLRLSQLRKFQAQKQGYVYPPTPIEQLMNNTTRKTVTLNGKRISTSARQKRSSRI
jgi:hypothetical protein